MKTKVLQSELAEKTEMRSRTERAKGSDDAH